MSFLDRFKKQPATAPRPKSAASPEQSFPDETLPRPSQERDAPPAPREEPASEPVAQESADQQLAAVPLYGPRRVHVIPEERFSLDDTNRLAELMEIPREQRTAEWVENFQAAAWNASIVLPEQAGFLGPDGMPYVRLELPPPGEPVETNCLSNIFASVAEQGFGAAFFPSSTEGPEAAEYVLPMGVLESLRSFGTWDGDPTDTAEILARPHPDPSQRGMEETVVPTERQVMVGSPSEDYLPRHTARLIYRHLTEGWKIEDPRVALIVDAEMTPSRSLVIGRKFSEFPDAETAAHASQMLLWYFPPRRTLLLMPENWTNDQLRPLKELC